MTGDPIEPDAVLLPADYERLARVDIASASIAWQGEGGATSGPDADTSWIEAIGFEVTRKSPPIGSITVGIPGVGFDLLVPDEHGRNQLAEAYDARGQQIARSLLTGRLVPGVLSQAAGSQGKGTDEVSGAPVTDEQALDDELFGGLGIVHDRTLD